MSFAELPEEIVVEQLRHLPIQDVLSACQTDLRFSQICQGRRLWQTLIHDRAPHLRVYLEAFDQLEQNPPPRGQRVMLNLTYMDNGQSKTERVPSVYIHSIISGLLEVLLGTEHKRLRTPVYEAFINKIEATRQKTPVPPFSQPVGGDLVKRKQEMIEFLIQNTDQRTFDRGLFGYKSHQDFIDGQKRFIIGMSDQQLQTLEFLRSEILPVSSSRRFFLSATGKIVFKI